MIGAEDRHFGAVALTRRGWFQTAARRNARPTEA
jgi:hypothetical protein